MTKKKSILIITIVVLLCISIITGVTYALWNVTRTQEDTNIVTSSCFSVT